MKGSWIIRRDGFQEVCVEYEGQHFRFTGARDIKFDDTGKLLSGTLAPESRILLCNGGCVCSRYFEKSYELAPAFEGVIKLVLESRGAKGRVYEIVSGPSSRNIPRDGCRATLTLYPDLFLDSIKVIRAIPSSEENPYGYWSVIGIPETISPLGEGFVNYRNGRDGYLITKA